MKKIATLLLAAGLVFGAATGASAIDFKAKGQWIMSFDYGQNGGFTGGNGKTGFNQGGTQYKNEDEFESRQRVRLQLDAVASEALSGTVFFEIGEQTWGRSDQGGSLGADGANSVKVKNAYIDWLVPQTDLKIRMGIQGMALPSFTTGSNIFNDDVAGITASYQFNETVGVTALWARPYNDNYANDNDHGKSRYNYMDNMDVFALLVPLTFDGVKVTPWAMYSAIGPNTFRKGNNYYGNSIPTSAKYPVAGMMPVGGALHKDGTTSTKAMGTYGNAVWAGLTGEVTAFDPFRFAWDFNYGSVSYEDSRANRAGWLGSLLFEYKLDWAIPGLYAWYASGDDSNPSNGSERMPSISVNNNNNGFSDFAFNGGPMIGREAILGYDMSGTWGIGARLKDMSFIENLKHTFRLNLIGGTNSTTMTRYLTGRNTAYQAITTQGPNSQQAGMNPLYMTTNDTALEIGLSNEYKMYDNFTVALDAAYIATWLDQSKGVWGTSKMNGRSDQERDPWNVNVRFVYSF
ncbi:outer membrane homotrimeric porin [Desulfovibrio desulfuricans]|uniref:outer membrane homotrimeric porin n=1 Tax=Desulfovibrio desulfuricans TaxID=876 RepID=UPI001AE22005|nr:outer membrane homotrimeric porin [Desulfovibrio desulfuricans]QTO39813.1 outer membrane homotrimeric porin [Desulfovibrio desulfuricans]